MRRMSIFCNDLIYRSLERINESSKIQGMRTDRQTHRFAISKIETQFYKVREYIYLLLQQ